MSIVFLSGCVKSDDFNFDKIATSTWDPDIAMPLINSNLTIKDLIGIADSGTFSIDPNHFVTLIYRNTLYSVHTPDLITIPYQQDNQSIQLNTTDSTTLRTTYVDKIINRTLPLNFPNNAILTSIGLRNAFLKIGIQSFIPLNGQLTVSIPSLSKNSIPFIQSVNFTTVNGIPILQVDSFDLASYVIDLTTGSNQLGIIYTARFNSPQSMPARVTTLDFNITTGINEITPASVFGNLGNQQLTINEDTSRITFFDNLQNGSVFFQDPKMTISFFNSFGIPISLNITSIVAHNNNGAILPLYGYPSTVQLPIPSQPGQTAEDSIVLTPTNSNIQPGMAINPNYIVYSLVANTASTPSGFVLDSSSFNAKVRIDLPLRGYASAFTVQDTADFTLAKIENIESAVFRINMSNGFPATSLNQIYFTDSNYVVLDSMFMSSQNNIIQSAQIDNNGIVIAPTFKMSDEPFDSQRLNRLFSCKKLLLKSVIDTYDSPNRIVEIYDYYKTTIKIGVRIKLKIKL